MGKNRKKTKSITTKIGSIFVVIFRKSTPNKVEKKFQSTKNHFEEKKDSFKKYTEKKKNLLKNKSDFLLERSLEMKTLAFQKSSKLALDAKNFKPKEVDYKKKFLFVSAFIVLIMKKSQVWLLTLKPVTVIGGLSVTTVVGLTTINFYSQVNKIASKIDEGRTPDSIGKNNVKKVRATYHKQTEKELKIQGLNMPIYIGESKKLKSVVIDFTMVASNRYIPNFFENKPYYLVDKMNSTLHPFIPEMSLKSEGKIIIKNKIKKELNTLLKKLHIKGEIKEIHIHSLLAG